MGGVVLASLLLTGCHQKMERQPSYRTFEPSRFYANGASARTPVAGTVPRGDARRDTPLYTGRTHPGGSRVRAAGLIGALGQGPLAALVTFETADPLADEFPLQVDAALLTRGQERFNIYCAMCHGMTGYGDGMVARRGFTKPPSYHTPRLRQARVGHFFDVITNGYGAMPDHDYLVPPKDRWAIISYVRALQLSQHASLEDVPEAERESLARTGVSR